MWQTRTLATFIAATVPVESAGDANPLMESAMSIGEPEQQDQPAEVPVPEPPAGSLERFLGSFGSPARWAGH